MTLKQFFVPNGRALEVLRASRDFVPGTNAVLLIVFVGHSYNRLGKRRTVTDWHNLTHSRLQNGLTHPRQVTGN